MCVRTTGPAAAALACVTVLAACGDGDGGDAPSVVIDAAPAAAPLFREVAEARGLSFIHSSRPSGEYPIVEMLGSGAAFFDANGDGWLDVYLADNAPMGSGDRAPDRLFLGRDGEFVDASDRLGGAASGWSIGVAAGDIDNDGDEDLFVACWGADVLLRNDGEEFTDVTATAGLAGETMSSSAVMFDFDGDGYLDIYVCGYVHHDASKVCDNSSGGREYCGPSAYSAIPDTLYRNRGDGTFEDVSEASGIASQSLPALGAAVADFSGDGLLDVYVANDKRANLLWINQGDGTFVDEAVMRGIALSGAGQVEASMGVDIADVNGDAHLDVFVTHIRGETNTLYLGDQRGLFRDASAGRGVGGPSRPMTAFGAAFLDLELDGDPDLIVANGRVARTETASGASAVGGWTDYAEANQLFVNDGSGQFVDQRDGADALTSPAEVTRGLAVGDFDADGDADVLLTNIGGPVRLLENVAQSSGRWAAVLPMHHGRAARGARVELSAGGQTRVGISGAGSSYLCTSEPVARFGVPAGATGCEVTITWPGGERETFRGLVLDRTLRLERGDGQR